jgi:hypothetical protein
LKFSIFTRKYILGFKCAFKDFEELKDVIYHSYNEYSSVTFDDATVFGVRNFLFKSFFTQNAKSLLESNAYIYDQVVKMAVFSDPLKVPFLFAEITNIFFANFILKIFLKHSYYFRKVKIARRYHFLAILFKRREINFLRISNLSNSNLFFTSKILIKRL